MRYLTNSIPIFKPFTREIVNWKNFEMHGFKLRLPKPNFLQSLLDLRDTEQSTLFSASVNFFLFLRSSFNRI
jgi:hypothetical protein